MLCQSCSRPITVRNSLLLNGAPRADICADCPTVSCKFCGVSHEPGHKGCSGYPNYGEPCTLGHGPLDPRFLADSLGGRGTWSSVPAACDYLRGLWQRRAAFPTLPVGSRVQHLGSPGSIGTVARCEPLPHACNPIHVELVVDWDDGSRSRCGIQSVLAV